ncbi:MAG: RNA polymerase sigma factor [Christensenellales bacterium]
MRGGGDPVAKLPSRADAEDAVQEASVKAYRNRGSLSDPARFRAWIIQITRNQIRDFYRARGRMREDAAAQAWRERLAPTPPRRDVTDTLDCLPARDRDVLRLYYLNDRSVSEIARGLSVPEGTVKSRLHAARGRFRDAYPLTMGGEDGMKNLPERMPDYTMTRLDDAPFAVRFEEAPGLFIVPRLGEEIEWAMYDFPERTRTNHMTVRVAGKASVHGEAGVEVILRDHFGEEAVERAFVMQLTDTHLRILSETHMDGDVKRTVTFLDGDAFIADWGYGADNCGREIPLSPKGAITRAGAQVIAAREGGATDVVGRYAVAMDGNVYDTICLMELMENDAGVAVEQYIDRGGRTVLRRRFNADGWKAARYGGAWSKRLPENERLIINGEVYVHWYDCLTSRA